MKIYDTLYKNNKIELYKEIEQKIKSKEKTFIVTANPETYMLSEKDKEEWKKDMEARALREYYNKKIKIEQII